MQWLGATEVDLTGAPASSETVESHFECLIPGLILSAEALCERSQVSLSIAAFSGETILLYFQL